MLYPLCFFLRASRLLTLRASCRDWWQWARRSGRLGEECLALQRVTLKDYRVLAAHARLAEYRLRMNDDDDDDDDDDNGRFSIDGAAIGRARLRIGCAAWETRLAV